MTNIHRSVLLHEAIEGLEIKAGDVVLDATLGGGGHSLEICKMFDVRVTQLGIDADELAIRRTEKLFSENKCSIKTALGNFKDAKDLIKELKYNKVDKMILDLGLSSYQLGESGRGFSFQYDEPLQMTLKANPSKDDVTAFDVVNTWKEESLAGIIYGFGEERYSRRIARAIIAARKEKEIKTTFELKNIIEAAVPNSYKHGRIHPATRTFQAIRIAVNGELDALQKVLDDIPQFISSNGRVAIISFHSLEDRIVKNKFKKLIDDGAAERITKKPIVPTSEEIINNPRARSAKLRIIKIK